MLSVHVPSPKRHSVVTEPIAIISELKNMLKKFFPCPCPQRKRSTVKSSAGCEKSGTRGKRNGTHQQFQQRETEGHMALPQRSKTRPKPRLEALPQTRTTKLNYFLRGSVPVLFGWALVHHNCSKMSHALQKLTQGSAIHAI